MSNADGTAPIKSCCLSGHIHAGTPTGREETLHGLPTYITKDGSKDKTFVFLTDIFGYHLNNARLLADEWATKTGGTVYVPDIFNGDPIPVELLNVIVPNLREQERKSAVEKTADTVKMGATFGPWAIKHRDAVTVPIVHDFLNAVRADPTVKKLVTVGFCFGGRHAVLTASGESPLVDAAVAFHPSGLALPAELEAIKKPVLISIGDKDAIMGIDQVDEAARIFNERKSKDPSLKLDVKVYPQAVHGFAIRGDADVESEKKLKEQGNSDALAWLDSVL